MWGSLTLGKTELLFWWVLNWNISVSKNLQRGSVFILRDAQSRLLWIFNLVLDMYDGAGDDVEAGQVRIGGHLGEERSPWATHSW